MFPEDARGPQARRFWKILYLGSGRDTTKASHRSVHSCTLPLIPFFTPFPGLL